MSRKLGNWKYLETMFPGKKYLQEQFFAIQKLFTRFKFKMCHKIK